MRIALSILVCVIAAVFFSLSAQANYTDELSLYDNCKKQYPNGSCDGIPLFSKKSLIEQSSKCQVSPEIFASLESTISCSSVNSINKTCFDKFKPQITQLISNHCASENQKAAQATAASSRSSAAAAGGTDSGKGKEGKDNNGADLMGLAKSVGKPLLAATGLKDKVEDYGKKVLNEGFGGSSKSDTGKVSHDSSIPSAQQNVNTNTNATPAYAGQQMPGKDSPNWTATNVKKPESPNAVPSQTLTESATPSSVTDSNSKDDPATVPAATAANQTVAPEAAKKVGETLPVAGEPANKIAKDSQPGVQEKAAEGVTTEITQTAAEANASMVNESTAVSSKANDLVSDPNFQFVQSKAAIDLSIEKIKKYVATVKKTCTSSSEKAGFLCLDSPGAADVKKLMDIAGPALATFNSAQKSCSATADVTRLAGIGLTIAKGVCVASKLHCDFSCSAAVKTLGKTKAELEKDISLGFKYDVDKAQVDIANAYAQENISRAKAIENAVKEKAGIIQDLSIRLSNAIEKELVPTNPGTSAGTVVKCQDHMKDIALLAANAAGSFMAQKNAKACAEKLKTGGEGATVAEYCAQPTNVSSGYCKCQRDNTQVGCAGAIVTSSTFNRPTDDKGSVQRGGGGASAFAGPGVNGVNADIGKVDSPLSGGSKPTGFSDKTNDAASAGYRGSGGGAGSAASGGGGNNPELASKEEPEKKKWSFGAFTGGFGSFGGGSGSGKGAADSAKIGQKAMDAKRAIASEQWRAEVTASSGKSNFEKVRESYLKKTTSLLDR